MSEDKTLYRPGNRSRDVHEWFSQARGITGDPVVSAIEYATDHPSRWADVTGHPDLRVRFHNGFWYVEADWSKRK